MTIETHNWSSSAHQELHKIVRDEIFPIVNQVDTRVQNFKIQFLKEAAKFVRDFKSLANEADASLAKHKALELEIERLLKAVVSQDIMIIVQNKYVADTSNLQTELELEPEFRTIIEMADNRTMEELLQAPTEEYGEAIIIQEINADHFEIKTNLLQLVQANPYHGFERENPHTHINNFKRYTSTLKFRDVPNDGIKLMMFPYSLEGNARVWYDKEPPNSILTWKDLVNKFVNQFFPPSKTTHLKNEISRFTQRFEETFREAWEQFKEMLRACPQHGFTELAQIDTFYNGLNDNDQDSLNAATGGNLLKLADRSITRPKGVAEDVFIKVGKFHFPTDFVVVDFEADPRVPLILGRSFLRTNRALIDIYGEEITLRVNDEAVTFNLNQTTRYSSTYDDLSVNRIDIIDVAKEEYA
nr:reverse transcriptase domain-containing protein [Tanacetum cinerariifolium]